MAIFLGLDPARKNTFTHFAMTQAIGLRGLGIYKIPSFEQPKMFLKFDEHYDRSFVSLEEHARLPEGSRIDDQRMVAFPADKAITRAGAGLFGLLHMLSPEYAENVLGIKGGKINDEGKLIDALRANREYSVPLNNVHELSAPSQNILYQDVFSAVADVDQFVISGGTKIIGTVHNHPAEDELPSPDDMLSLIGFERKVPSLRNQDDHIVRSALSGIAVMRQEVDGNAGIKRLNYVSLRGYGGSG